MLSDNEKRARYDRMESGAAPDVGAGRRAPRTDDEIRRDVLRDMVDEIDRDVTERLRKKPVPTYDDIALIARTRIIFNQRYLPFSSLQTEDFWTLMIEYALHRDGYRGYSENGLVALAGGVIMILNEHARYTGEYGQTVRDALARIKSLVETRFRQTARQGRSDYLDNIWRYLTGQSYFSRSQPQAYAQQLTRQQSAGCQTLLTEARMVDANGNVWVISVQISIKIGY